MKTGSIVLSERLRGTSIPGGSGVPLRNKTLQCNSKRYFTNVRVINSLKRVLSAINSSFIAGDYRSLSHGTLRKAILLGYGITILSNPSLSTTFYGPFFFPLPVNSTKNNTKLLFSETKSKQTNSGSTSNKLLRGKKPQTSIKGQEVHKQRQHIVEQYRILTKSKTKFSQPKPLNTIDMNPKKTMKNLFTRVTFKQTKLPHPRRLRAADKQKKSVKMGPRLSLIHI